MSEFKSEQQRRFSSKHCHMKGCENRVRPDDGFRNEPGFRWPESMRQMCSEHTPSDDE
jgi:hypothetical protein